jgi:circadian clock protein KaiC
MTEPMALPPPLARVPSGVPGLDVILQGGFLRGGIYILEGAPGAGKTILGNQVAFHHVVSGGRGIYLTLLGEMHTRMFAHLNTLTFFNPTVIGDALYYVSGYSALAQAGLAELLKLVHQIIRERHATLLVVDGLSTARAFAESDLAFEQFLQQVHVFCDLVGCTALLISGLDSHRSHPEHTMVDGLIKLSWARVGLRSARELEVLKCRGTDYLEGHHNYTITTAGFVVFPRTEALLASPQAIATIDRERMDFGLPNLDLMLHGGLLSSSTTMILGAPGSGKTLLGTHFLAAGARQGQAGLHFGFYETPTRLLDKAQQVGLDLSSFNADGLLEIVWQSPLEEILDALAERLLAAVQRRQVRRLFIDGLNGFHAAAVYPERMGRFLTALTHELRRLNVTTVFSMETRDLFVPTLDVPVDDLSAVVENIIFLRYAERRSDVHRLISILKLRESGYDPTIRRFTIGDAGLAVEAPFEGVETNPGRIALQSQQSVATSANRRTTRKRGR